MIKNREQLIKNFQSGKILIDLAEEALEYLNPENLVNLSVKKKSNALYISGKKFDLKLFENIYVLGGGKATYGMAKAINKLLGNKIKNGFINVPEIITKKIGNIIVNKAFHPLPDIKGLSGAKEILKIIEKASKKDLIICLISGGGSALLPAPIPPITLKNKINLTKKLLKSGAEIHEINTIRKHISLIKGGNLAAKAKCKIIALYISDVKNDDLNIIASGPTVLDDSTSMDALKILKKYGIKNKKIENVIQKNETPKSFPKNKIFNFIIGSNSQALNYLKKKNKNSLIFSNFLEGEANKMPNKIIEISKKHKSNKIFIFGGETVVKVKGKGLGGRNQELALSMLNKIKENMDFITLATDGVDGITPSPVAGAIISAKVKKLCEEKGIKINEYLKNNDSYSCLKMLDCLLYTGPSGTNVGDIAILKT